MKKTGKSSEDGGEQNVVPTICIEPWQKKIQCNPVLMYASSIAGFVNDDYIGCAIKTDHFRTRLSVFRAQGTCLMAHAIVVLLLLWKANSALPNLLEMK